MITSLDSISRMLEKKIVEVSVTVPTQVIGENPVLQVEAIFLPLVRIQTKTEGKVNLEFSLGTKGKFVTNHYLKNPEDFLMSLEKEGFWDDGALTIDYGYKMVRRKHFLLFTRTEKVRTVTFVYKWGNGATQVLLTVEKSSFVDALKESLRV